MTKYEVTVPFTLNDEELAIGTIVELSDEQALEFGDSIKDIAPTAENTGAELNPALTPAEATPAPSAEASSVPEATQTPVPGTLQSAPAAEAPVAEEKKEGWAGNHTMPNGEVKR